MTHWHNSARHSPGHTPPGTGTRDLRWSEQLHPERVGTPSGPGTPVGAGLVGWGRFVFRHRNLLFPLVLISLFAAFRPRYPWGSERLDHWLDALGFAIALAGQGVRVAASGYARVMRSGKDRQVHAERLVTEGLYRHSRNPLYLGNLLILLGLFMIHNNPWVYAMGIPFFLLAYQAIVRAEEIYLRDRFGEEYKAYCDRVGRWVPRLGNARQSVQGLRFSWRRVIRQEHGSAFAWSVTALLLLGYDTLVYFSYDQRSSYMNGLVLLLACAIGCWAAARGLKRRGRLND
jgi:protein-S-isoprenylcysteine O-methyltransferase Ste14